MSTDASAPAPAPTQASGKRKAGVGTQGAAPGSCAVAGGKRKCGRGAAAGEEGAAAGQALMAAAAAARKKKKTEKKTIVSTPETDPFEESERARVYKRIESETIEDDAAPIVNRHVAFFFPASDGKEGFIPAQWHVGLVLKEKMQGKKPSFADVQFDDGKLWMKVRREDRGHTWFTVEALFEDPLEGESLGSLSPSPKRSKPSSSY